MRLINHRSRQRGRGSRLSRIAISQAEITADLHYPAASAAARPRQADAGRRGVSR